MSFEKMTITLDDVSTLLSIPMVGNTVSIVHAHVAWTLVSCTLRVTNEEVSEELGSAHGQSTRMEWLRSKFERRVSDRSGEKVINCSTRIYLLYLIGCMLFTDKIESRVPVGYLQCLEDLDTVHIYTRGSAPLAFLYWHLGVASM